MSIHEGVTTSRVPHFVQILCVTASSPLDGCKVYVSGPRMYRNQHPSLDAEIDTPKLVLSRTCVEAVPILYYAPTADVWVDCDTALHFILPLGCHPETP